MAKTDQIPTLPELMSTATTAIVAKRPRANDHLAFGRWGDILDGWSAQAALCRRRLSAECLGTRLPLSSAAVLRDLVRDYNANAPVEAFTAIGEVRLTRSVTNASPATSGNFGSAGEIRQGSRFRRPADETVTPERKDASYESTEPVVVDDVDTSTTPVPINLFRHDQTITVPIRALVSGPVANTPAPLSFTFESIPGSILDTLFDTRFEVDFLRAAGGCIATPSDQKLRALAAATYLGQYGPTDLALVAGALSLPGVERAAVTHDTTNGIAKLWITDPSWGGSERWASYVKQKLHDDDWIGFGCRVQVGYIFTTTVRVVADVLLSDSKYASQTDAIASTIRELTKEYFEERPDWWSWRKAALGGIISRSDKIRILACTNVVVQSAGGTPLQEPSAHFSDALAYLIPTNAVRVNFTTPS